MPSLTNLTLGPLAIVVLALGAGCGSNIGNPSDAALMQTAREIRDGLKLPPEDRPVETLNLTRAIQIAAQGQRLDDTGNTTPAGEPRPPTVEEQIEAERLAAVGLAQDARLALIAGDEEKARGMLEQSLADWATVDALEPIAPMLATDEQFDELDRHCDETWRLAADAAERSKILEVCIAYGDGDTIDEIIPWAPDDVRDALSAPIAVPGGAE